MTASAARISLLTLGVSDVPAATRFYQALGWVRAPQSAESTAFLQGENLVLSLWQRDEMIADCGEGDFPPGSGSVALAVNLESREAVDALYAQAVAAGARAVKPPSTVFWGGYSGNFRDPDNHLWEIAHNPFFAMDENGRLDLLGGEAR